MKFAVRGLNQENEIKNCAEYPSKLNTTHAQNNSKESKAPISQLVGIGGAQFLSRPLSRQWSNQFQGAGHGPVRRRTWSLHTSVRRCKIILLSDRVTCAQKTNPSRYTESNLRQCSFRFGVTPIDYHVALDHPVESVDCGFD